MEYEEHFKNVFFENADSFEYDDKNDKDTDEKLKKSQEVDNILKSVWEKSSDIKAKQKKLGLNRLRPKFNERDLISNKGFLALKLLFDNYKINENVGPYENLNQILLKMEYWAHSFFPQLNFEDFVEKVQRLGHKRILRSAIDRIRNGDNLDDNEIINENKETNDETKKKKKADKEKTAEELFDEQFGNNFYNEDDFFVSTN